MTTNRDTPKPQYPEDDGPLDDEQLRAIAETVHARHGRAVVIESVLDGRREVGLDTEHPCWRQEEAIARLLAIAADIVASSTSPDAENFDVSAWLKGWLQLPQPALGGKKPVDVLVSPGGEVAVARVLGALASGAYQ